MTETYDLDLEQNKYDWLYSQGYPPGSDVLLHFFNQLNLDSWDDSVVTDFGCGRATLYDSVGSKLKAYYGVDLSSVVIDAATALATPKQTFIQASLTALPKSLPVADIGWCSDVMEHVHPGAVPLVLKQMLAKANILYLLICCRPSRFLGPGGEQLHLCVQQPQWWLHAIERVAGVGAVTGYSIGDSAVYRVESKSKNWSRKP